MSGEVVTLAGRVVQPDLLAGLDEFRAKVAAELHDTERVIVIRVDKRGHTFAEHYGAVTPSTHTAGILEAVKLRTLAVHGHLDDTGIEP